jgi:hypothetical protein
MARVTGLGIVLGACLVLPYGSRTVQAALRPYLEPEAYRVYEAILPENPAYTDAVSALIRGKTISYDPDCLQPDVRYRASATAAIADYKRRNRSSVELQPLFHLTKSYEILPESEFIGTPIRPRNSSPWRQYLLRHPNFPGFIEFSQVGFNKDKTIAVVYMVHNCGVMCSGGDVIVLGKKGGRWRSLDMRGFVCFWKS